MFGTKLEAAQARIAGLVALLASTGFKIEADAATFPTAADLGAHLEAQNAGAIQKATAPLAAAKVAAEAQASAYRSAFEAAGIKLDLAAADFTAPKEGEAAPAVAKIKTAVETAIAQRAARQIAGAGHPSAIETAPGAEPGTAADADATPANAADFMATHKALKQKDPLSAQRYFRAHHAKFPVR